MNYSRAVYNLSQYSVKKNAVEFSGVNGKIKAEVFREGVYSIDFQFDSYPVPNSSQEISEIFFSSELKKESEMKEPSFSKIIESDKEYHLYQGANEFVFRKDTGLLSIFQDKQLVHGGQIGTNDTVIPHYPLRIVGKYGNDMLARFNFKLDDDDRFYGLGDKTGSLNRRGRFFRMYNRDSLGYQASISDPLYKSVPFFIKHNPEKHIYTGILFPVPVVKSIDLGKESPYYFSAEIVGGPYSYIVITGTSAWEILDKYTWLTGRPTLPPLYTFGFLGSSMNYTEPDKAAELVSRYFDNIEKYNIPCEGFYFSSGYVKADNGERYTFMWNKKKFPDPEGAIRKYCKRGYHIACNIKPGFLITHPLYKELDEKGYFLKDKDGNSIREYYWGNDASFIDFNNPDALSWWKKMLTDKIFAYGISGVWNDNNELELEDLSLPVQKIRSGYPVRMARAAWEASKEFYPQKRPWVISRSGGIGLQKYARTWTGDNVSDWESMKYNILMGMGLGLSGIPYYGHDIGGFYGEKPDTKQFIRWCQTAVFQPRFVIHSWNEDGNPTEIWSYPESIDVLRELVEIHYEFMPYIYNTAIEASLSGLPMERPLSLMFPESKNIKQDSVHYMFGEDILVLSAVNMNQDSITVSLPEGTRWKDSDSQEMYNGGQSITIEYPYRGVRYLVREGSILFTSPGCRKLDTGFFKKLRISILPLKNHVFSRVYREDNGEDTFSTGSYNQYKITVDYRDTIGEISIIKEKSTLKSANLTREVELILPDNYEYVLTDALTPDLAAYNKLKLINIPDTLNLGFRLKEE